MFVLTEMRDTVRLAPHKFHTNFQVALQRTLNEKLANKVVPGVGLCICLYDMVSIGDSFILPGDGAAHTSITYRFVVFRPFVDELVVGRIESCSRQGISISVNLFDDIFVPADKLPNVSKFDETDQIWYWEYPAEDNDGDDQPAKLYMDPGKMVRFRVVEEHFADTQPVLNTGPDQHNKQGDTLLKPYTITASMSESGLGCLQWWQNNEEVMAVDGE